MRKIILVFCAIIIGSAGFCADFNVFKLNNGQTVVIKEVHTNPIVTIDTWIKTGSINENDQNNGVSHFLEHLFFKGTEKYPVGEFDKILEAKGAVNNAATSKDFTHYYITIPSDNFDLAMEMHADMLQSPAIPNDELQKERLVVLEEISKDINSPTTKVYDNLVKMLYTTHPYKRKVIGESKIVSAISRDEILDYFNTYYSPSNMITVIVGDVDTKNALNKVSSTFIHNKKKTVKNNFEKEKLLTSLCRNIEYMQAQSGYMLIGFRGVKVTDKDNYALDVLSTILGGGKSSVLYQNIKDKKQLAFSIYAQNSTMKDDGIFYISSDFVPKNQQALEENIFLEILNIQKNGVTREQLQTAQNIIEQDTYFTRESISNIAQEVGYTFVTGGDIKLYEDYIKNIKKVSLDDIKRVANKYLGMDKAAISIVLPENLKATKEIKISNKIQTDTTSQFISENNGTEKYNLSNGATLLYTPNDINDIIAVSIYIKGGEFLEKIPGTAKLCASTMLKGTVNYTSNQLAQIMEENGIKIVPSSKADAFSITLLTTKPQYEKALCLLDEIVNRATFNESEIEKIKTETINTIRKNRDFPLKKALEEHNTNIYKGSIYSNSTKILEKTYPAIKKQDIQNYYNNIFEPNNMVISINGNVDKDRTIEEFVKIFTNKNCTKFDYSKYNIAKVSTPRISEIIDSNTQTDWIILAWQTGGIMNQKDYATLSVIDSLLGSGMSSRLFKNLRDKEGLAYQLGSSYNPNILRGSFVTYIGTNPKTLELSKKRLFEQINLLKTEKVSSQELKEAKDKLTGNFVISQETNLDKASTIGWFEATGRNYDFDYKRVIENVTGNDIIEVANKYFNNNYVLSIVKK